MTNPISELAKLEMPYGCTAHEGTFTKGCDNCWAGHVVPRFPWARVEYRAGTWDADKQEHPVMWRAAELSEIDLEDVLKAGPLKIKPSIVIGKWAAASQYEEWEWLVENTPKEAALKALLASVEEKVSDY